MTFWLVQELVKAEGKDAKEVEVERHEYGYGDVPVAIMDLLRSPMTLSQGARIMNEYRRSNGDIHDEN